MHVGLYVQTDTENGRTVGFSFCYDVFVTMSIMSLMYRILTYFPQGALQNQTLQYAGWSSSGNALVCISANLRYQSDN